jgi:hypothetical protein
MRYIMSLSTHPHIVKLHFDHLEWDANNYRFVTFTLNDVIVYTLVDPIACWLEDNIDGEWSMPVDLKIKEEVPRPSPYVLNVFMASMSFEHAEDALAFEMKWL